MTRVAGPSLDQLDRLGDDYAGLVVDALVNTAIEGAATPEGPEGLVMIRAAWQAHVDRSLLPALGVAFEVGAAQVRVGLREAVGLTAAAFTDVAPTSDALAEQYLAQARKRLVGVGDELWAHAREELLEGLQAGEGIPELAARVRKVAPDLTEARAAQIARTEVLGSTNAGALEQVLASGATGTKEWVSGHDALVRPEHEHADNQTVGLREFFTVGGFPAARPHDPSLPPHLSVSCRCALSFDLDLPDLEPLVVESEPEEFDRATRAPRQAQKRDRSFLARVFSDGLAALVGWFKARTASAQGDDNGPDRHREPLQLPPAQERPTPPGAREHPGRPAAGNPQPERRAARGPGEVAGGDQAGGGDVLGQRRLGPDARRGLAAAAGQPNTGAMIALVPSEADLARLPLAGVVGSEPREELHLTLAFLGQEADWTLKQQQQVFAHLQARAAIPGGPYHGEGFGANYWNPGSDSPSWNLAVGGQEVERAHDFLWQQLDAMTEDGQVPPLPEQHAPWAPHICLAYTDDTALAETVAERVGPITFDRLRVAFGEDVTDLPLAAAMIVPEQEFARGGAVTVEHFRSRMITEGLSTGLRTFAPGSLVWRDPPFALRWQKIEPESGGHGNAVHVGNVSRAERQGNEVWGYGPLDLDSPDGLEYARKLATGNAPWVSIGLDEQPVDVEVVLPEETGDGLEALMVEPDQLIFHSGRIAELTGVTAPAQAEAFIEATPALLADLRARGVLEPEEALAAAASLDDYRPPAEWFADPRLAEPTGIVVEESGQVPGLDWMRIYGHAALSTSCHIGFADQCVSPPHEADHPYFLTGEVVTADGSRVPVGQVTLATGHAPLSYGAQKAAAHYDDTGSVVADVTCGNDEHGIWVAGAVRPGTDPARVHELRASGQLSGDWRRIGGQLRLVALLAVNVPGFPVPRPRARVASGSAQALVAAGKVDHDAGQGRPDLSKVKQRIARPILKSRKAAAAARVKARG